MLAMNVSIIGIGYVGLANAVIFGRHSNVCMFDIISAKVDMINNKISPIKDAMIDAAIRDSAFHIVASADIREVLSESELVVIATSTDCEEKSKCLDTQSIDYIIETIYSLRLNPLIVIKSTVPIGHTEKLCKKYPHLRILYSPEFLREETSVIDSMSPDRIIIGGSQLNDQNVSAFIKILKTHMALDNIPVEIVSYSEAEAIKLFSNAYLAMRIAFFNELDTFAELMELESEKIIQGVCCDKRIGNYYNNPSFGYGGYCLPKDTTQLASQFNYVPENIISSISNSNLTRKKHIVAQIKHRIEDMRHDTNFRDVLIGIYRVGMKAGASNARNSSSLDIAEQLQLEGYCLLIYEPELTFNLTGNYMVTSDIAYFKKEATLIIANRMNSELGDVHDIVYTRDIFGYN